MKLSAKEILGYAIRTEEGSQGNSLDFLFDQSHWTLRYAEVDFGSIFSSRKLLIPNVFLNGTDWKSKCFLTDLKNADLSDCPGPKDFKSISKEFEERLNKHLDNPDYWAPQYTPPAEKMDVTHTYTVPSLPIQMPGKFLQDKDVPSDLRSFKELLGYTVKSRAGKIGELTDVIVETEDWKMISLIVHITERPANGKDVIIATLFISEIDSAEKCVYLDLTEDSISNSNEFELSEPVNEVIVKETRDFRGRPA